MSLHLAHNRWGETDRGQGWRRDHPARSLTAVPVTSRAAAELTFLMETHHTAHIGRDEMWNGRWESSVTWFDFTFHISLFELIFFNLITSPYSGEFSHRIPWLLLQENKKTGILQILCKLILIFTSNYNKSWILAFVSFVIRGLLMVSESWESSQLSGVKYF